MWAWPESPESVQANALLMVALPRQRRNFWAIGFPFIFRSQRTCLVLWPFTLQAVPKPGQLSLRAWCHVFQSWQEAPYIAVAHEFCSKEVSRSLKFVSYTGFSAEEKWFPLIQSKTIQLHREEPVCFCWAQRLSRITSGTEFLPYYPSDSRATHIYPHPGFVPSSIVLTQAAGDVVHASGKHNGLQSWTPVNIKCSNAPTLGQNHPSNSTFVNNLPYPAARWDVSKSDSIKKAITRVLLIILCSS